MPIGRPGCPEFAFCTASIDSTRSAAAFIQWSGWDWRSSEMFTGTAFPDCGACLNCRQPGVAN